MPLHPPDALQVAALLLCHFRVIASPDLMVVRSAVRLTATALLVVVFVAGAGAGVGVVVCVLLVAAVVLLAEAVEVLPGETLVAGAPAVEELVVEELVAWVVAGAGVAETAALAPPEAAADMGAELPPPPPPQPAIRNETARSRISNTVRLEILLLIETDQLLCRHWVRRRRSRHQITTWNSRYQPSSAVGFGNVTAEGAAVKQTAVSDGFNTQLS
jgi:hypothetical protein